MANIGVGLYSADSGIESGVSKESLRGQAEFLVPMARDILAARDMAFADVDAIVTPLGPGTFTGLRIGLAAAKSFGLALNIPVFGISTLQILALQYIRSGRGDIARPVMVLIETKRSDFYVQVFDGKGHALIKAGCYELDELKALHNDYPDAVLIGDAVGRYGFEQDEDYALIDPLFLARSLQDDAEFFTRDIEPIYLRGADVSAPKNPPRSLVG